MLGSAREDGAEDSWPLRPGTFGAYVVTDDPDGLFSRAHRGRGHGAARAARHRLRLQGLRRDRPGGQPLVVRYLPGRAAGQLTRRGPRRSHTGRRASSRATAPLPAGPWPRFPLAHGPASRWPVAGGGRLVRVVWPCGGPTTRVVQAGAGDSGQGGSTRMTSSVRGPCTPSTRDSSMSLVAEGPLIQVRGRAALGPSRAMASGTSSTTWAACTMHRW